MKKETIHRPPFRAWLAERLTKYLTKKLFGEERDPKTVEEQEEFTDELQALWKRCWALFYAPHPKQSLFHKSRKSQVRGSFARNQGGKTTMFLIEILSWGFGEDLWSGQPIEKIGKTKWQPRMRFFIGAQDYSNAHAETILPKLNELLPLKELGVEFQKTSGIINRLVFPEPYSFSIKLLSYDQAESKQEGPTWNGGGFDEPPPRGMYVACRRGCMKHAAPIVFVATPLREPWMYDDIYAHKSSVHVETEADLKLLKWDSKAIIKIGRNDNPHITAEQMAAFEESLDEEEKQARIHGEFLHLQGRVYKSFDRATMVLDRDKFFVDHPGWQSYPSFCVMDPHDRKPFAIAWGVLTPRDEIVFIEEWPSFDFAKQKTWRWSIEEYAQMIRERERQIWTERGSDAVTWRIMDPNFGRTQKAGGGLTVEETFADLGLFFDTSVDDDIESGHMAVKSDIFNKRVFWLSNCLNSAKAMENYTWDDYRGQGDRAPKERPKDKFKDFADLVRYVSKSDLHYEAGGGTGQRNPWKH